MARKAGKDIFTKGPVCTMMVGRLDDRLKVVAEKEGIVTTRRYRGWAGVAVMNKAYRVYREHGYRPVVGGVPQPHGLEPVH